MAAAGVRVVPGFHGAEQSEARLVAEASLLGFPLLVKAVAGGGGKGLKLAAVAEEFLPALRAARREAEAAFGDGRVLLERFVPAPRHVEVQVRSGVGGWRVGGWFLAGRSFSRPRSLLSLSNPPALRPPKTSPPTHLPPLQIIADGAGSALALAERDCSVQRRHQKVLGGGRPPQGPDPAPNP
jgi:acetyl/propionyl-CoA carboxylase alpha subunit